ncbi:FadR/GntR family transcriptional regulator [Pusillimonas sp. SM2304]|uniref:FadR/GntR family transcriptional regulator n=1 Tax=Pusillimonas sp. SM2304 TaxID=3073241 RepID=UPI0028753AEC|nr:FadR/GntR family transcriptional regulator [Pusillimonas sp. SM2304]MDS1140643.1 FadR/GntR family transcriptional regulator [Pusillimonas sp. SM2304]
MDGLTETGKKPEKKKGTLADRVTQVLIGEIKDSTFPVHARLPSEVDMAQRFGVSRTVIREAISRLKSEGMVATRQGSGTRVLEPGAATPFRLDIDPHDSLQAVLRVIELRRGIEGEMAALAAERRSDAQCAHIRKAFNNIRKAERAGRDGVDEDVAFHTAISQASGNPLFLSLLSFLSQYVRSAIHVTRNNEARRADFSRQVQAEHAAILDAITRKDAAAARAAALNHIEHAAIRLQAADDAFWTADVTRVARSLSIDHALDALQK